MIDNRFRHLDWVFYLVAGCLVLVHLAKSIAIFLAGQPAVVTDDLGYCLMAKSMVETSGETIFIPTEITPTHLEIIRPLGYPMVLATIFAVFGSFGLVAGIIANHLFLLGALWLMVYLIGDVTQSRIAQLILLAISIPAFASMAHANMLLCESCLVFLVAVFVTLLTKWEQSIGWLGTVGIGGICGVMSIVKPSSNFLLAIPLLLLCARLPKLGWRPCVSYGGILLLTYGLFLSPFLLRNYANYGELFLTKASDAAIFWSAYGDGQGALDLPPPTAEIVGDLPEVDYRNWQRVLDLHLKATEVPIEAYKILGVHGRHAILTHPGEFLKKIPTRLWISATVPGALPHLTWTVEEGFKAKVGYWQQPGGFAWFTHDDYVQANGFARVELPRTSQLSIFNYLSKISEVSWEKFPHILLVLTILGWIGLIVEPQTRSFGIIVLLTTICLLGTHAAVSPVGLFRYRICIELLQFVAIATAIGMLAKKLLSKYRTDSSAQKMTTLSGSTTPSPQAVVD
ncbi:hypothetical protein [Blastopirellula marina]|uniref:Glycosyltransferase RgtA/B/C/D-like domain-containing protein n=1 Tax=Blastopirellula marina TaxID=124 RepID=A0A2S8F9R6_9BACT|nr:hypothetical protein [Blastopirellula marina]PQO28891.1 hypothetical protein C5Y98_24315 [Blastopirellula marina]PTL42164.1 hypothetical protein C5Y97_24330 [Blastopirellula marina]